MNSGLMMSGVSKRIVAAGFGAMTWDPANKAATDTLSGGDLTIANSSATVDNTHGLHTNARSSGQFYFEFLLGQTISTNNFSIGFCRTTVSTTGALGNLTDSVAWYVQGGQVVVENVTAATIQTATANGTTLALAIDLDTSLVWFRSSGNTNWNNAAIGSQNPAIGSQVGGISISGITGAAIVPGITLALTSSGTANFGATAYGLTPPTGFGNW